MRNKIVIGVMGVLLCCEGLLQAEPVTIQITGQITQIRNTETYPYQNTIHIGDTFTGTYTYNSAATNSSSQSGLGIYVQNAPYGFNISMGGFEFKTTANHVGQFGISIFNDYSLQTYDRYIIDSEQNVPLSTGLSVNSIIWDVSDNTHTAISSIALTSSAPVMSNWPNNTFSIGCGGPPNGNSTLAIWGTVTQATLVPEPCTLLLLGLGAAAIAARRKK
jgi:hypothetical protein